MEGASATQGRCERSKQGRPVWGRLVWDLRNYNAACGGAFERVVSSTRRSTTPKSNALSGATVVRATPVDTEPTSGLSEMDGGANSDAGFAAAGATGLVAPCIASAMATGFPTGARTLAPTLLASGGRGADTCASIEERRGKRLAPPSCSTFGAA